MQNDRWLRRDRAEFEELRALGLNYLEHAPVREVRFESMAARLEARRTFGAGFLRACRSFPELSSPADAHRLTSLDDVVEIEWRQRAAA